MRALGKVLLGILGCSLCLCAVLAQEHLYELELIQERRSQYEGVLAVNLSQQLAQGQQCMVGMLV